MDNWEEGRIGEQIIRGIFKNRNIHFFQADMIAKVKGEWQLIEVKYQEKFTKPPFDGHGLPKWQIEARLEFQKEKNVRAVLYVVDKKTGIIYWQYMDVLYNGEKHQTNGDKPRLIFPLENYNIWENNEIESTRNFA